MNKFFSKYVNLLLLVAFFSSIQGCSDKEQESADRIASNLKIQLDAVNKSYDKLESQVSDPSKMGKYEMTMLIALDQMKKDNIDGDAFDAMVKSFKMDTTTNGTLFKSVKEDYKSVLAHIGMRNVGVTPAKKKQVGEMYNFQGELVRISQVLNVKNYDERFVDYINTLAAISPSVSPVLVKDINKTASVGSQFVGNPNYGKWETDSSGGKHWSFLETYMYLSFIDNMMFNNNRGYSSYGSYRSGYNSRSYDSYGSNRYGYSNWSNTRNYSHYNDYYVNKYESPKKQSSYKRQKSSLIKQNAKTLKKDNNVSKQAKSMSKTNSRFSSSLIKPKANKTKVNAPNSSKSKSSTSSRKSSSSIKKSNSASKSRGK